jgi:hypothetical protein
MARLGRGASRFGAGAQNVGSDMVHNQGGVTGIVAGIFLVVFIAKQRGAQIDGKHALFGGFILMFFLAALAGINQRLAQMFALLVLTAALLEYGPTVLNGLTTKQATTTKTK